MLISKLNFLTYSQKVKMFSIYSIYRFFIPYYPYVDPDMLKDTSAILTVLGGFQLLDLIITELKSQMTC